MSRARRAAVTMAVAAVVAAGCTSPRRGSEVPVAGPGSASAQAPGLYVAVGASETVGEGTDNPLREAWPQVLFRTALAPSVAFVNLGVSGATVADALAIEVPRAERLDPTLVTVWLNVNDLIGGVPASAYQRSLAVVVHRLRATGATVLVANTPPLDHLPVYLACLDPAQRGDRCPPSVPDPLPPPTTVDADVDAYNAATAQVAAAEGAVLVDLHAAGLAARAQGREAGLFSGDGFHPNAAGAQAVAEAFAAALPAGRRAGGAA